MVSFACPMVIAPAVGVPVGPSAPSCNVAAVISPSSVVVSARPFAGLVLLVRSIALPEVKGEMTMVPPPAESA